MLQFCPPAGGTKFKHVKFSNLVSVVLIPTRVEFVDAGLKEDLWWGISDYNSFKSTAANELREYANLKNIHIFAAIIELYQPKPQQNIMGVKEIS